LEKAGYRQIFTGGSSVGSSGSLAVTDVFKLLDPEFDPIFREFYAVPQSNQRTSLVGPTHGNAFPVFTQKERLLLASLENGVLSISSSTAVIAMIDRWNTNRQQNQAGFTVPPATQTADFSKLYTMLSKGDIKVAVKFWVDRIFNSKPRG
jgi:hypothetical protein